jgi:hypothetical protein
MKKIKEELVRAEAEQIERKAEEVEQYQDDSRRMYQAVRILDRGREKKILIEGKDCLTSNEEEQTEIMTNFFETVFKQNEEKIKNIEPKAMTHPFIGTEVARAIKRLKNNKSAGIDEMYAELIKYGPIDFISEEIATIYNDTAKTGNFPTEIKLGILTPLPKPGKKQGPPGNMRPIILLSILRKILAIIMISRTEDRIKSKIPADQAAYQKGRSTTEQVWTFKVLIERAITSRDLTLFIILLDMSKAFDTVKRHDLIEILREILEEDELHIFKILIEDVKLTIRIGKTKGREITTDIGVPQGDCLSALLFILYLAEALRDTPQKHLECNIDKEHNYAKPRQSQNTDIFVVTPKYADDISSGAIGKGKTAKYVNEIVKKEYPIKLKSKNLLENAAKRKEYEIYRNGPEKWKTSKYLGSLMDTEKDIIRRKHLAQNAYSKLEDIFNTSKVKIPTKIKIFSAYISSIFLYNSETWTLTKNQEKAIDSFHRRLLRKILNIKWPKTLKDNEVYAITKETPWSKRIARRRLNWYGHLNRLPKETPARQALEEIRRPALRPKGGQKQTWIKNLDKQLESLRKFPEEDLDSLTHDRSAWRCRVRSTEL